VFHLAGSFLAVDTNATPQSRLSHGVKRSVPKKKSEQKGWFGRKLRNK
jgi:hypothetical protein